MSDLTRRAEAPTECDGMRLDAVAARAFPDYSRARLRSWIEQARVRVNGTVVSVPRQAVRAGDALELVPDENGEDSRFPAQAIPVDVVFADADVAVVHKPAGLVVHPGAGCADGTLQNALLHRFPQTAGVPRAGLVHRLDKDTSGLLVVALTLTAHARLVAAMARREIHREYDALVMGQVVAGDTIDAPIGRDPRHRTRMAVVRGGRHAVTHFTVVERFARHALLRVILETGRTHQIRVHMAHVRHPVAGDRVYGGRRHSGIEIADAFPRQALHARRIAFTHPVIGEELVFERAPPDDMQALFAALRAGAADD